MSDSAAGFNPMSPMAQQLDDLGRISRIVQRFRFVCDKPVVAGINGVAVGGGLGVGMAADIRLIARGARLLAGYARIGGSPDGGLSWTLSQAMGYEPAMRFLLDARGVTGEEAVRLGMGSELVEDAVFAERFREFCQSLTHLSPITARLTKRTLIRASLAVDVEEQLRYEMVCIRRAFGSEDGKEARRAFLERRPPVFHGR